MTEKLAEGSKQVIEDLQRRLDESLAQQAATADVLKVISRSTFDLQTVLDALVVSAAKLCDADRACIFQKKGDVYCWVSNFGFSPELVAYADTHPFAAGPHSTTSRVALEGKPIHNPDVLADPNYRASEYQRLGDYRTMLGIPLLREGETIGVFILTRKHVRPFTDRQIELVTSFADQAVIAIENVRLFDEVQAKSADLHESLQHQTATSEVLQVISRSPGELDPVFQAILSSASRICEAQFGLLLLYENGGFRCASMFNLPPAFAETFLRNPVIYPPPIDPLGRLLATRRLVHVVDVMQEQAYLTAFPPIVELVELGGARTLLLVPMLRETEMVGVIAIFRQTVQAFSDKQIALITSFGSQAVIAIENGRLLNELRQRTDDLSESLLQQSATADVLKVISRSAFDLKSVLATLVASAAKLCEAEKGVIFLREENSYRLVSNYGFSAEFEAFAKANPFPTDGGSTTTRAAESGGVVQVVDVLEDQTRSALAREYQRLGGYRTNLGVPLRREGETIGVFTLTRQEVKGFTPRQIELVETFADQAVIAIENARLFDEVQARTRELTLSLEELRTAQDRLVQTEKLASLGQLTAGIAHEIKNPLNFVNNFSALSADLIDELSDLLKPGTINAEVQAEIDELTRMLKGNLEKVVQHGKRADSIIKNMLLHSREGSGERRSSDINTIVEESLNLAYHGARAEKSGFNITLQRNLDPSVGMIDLYPQEITRVFLNLISNGFYAANKRQEAGDGGFEPSLTATTKNLGNTVEIRIRDNGTGIPAEVREKMFNPFFTTKPAGEGTGLGLSMSHDIVVKQHGGTIEVDTAPGQFTEFIVTLPRAGAKTRPGERN